MSDTKTWLNVIWSHQKKQRVGACVKPIPLRHALWASLLLLLGRWTYTDNSSDAGWTETAWLYLGEYTTDYGIGYAWETLAFSGTRITSYSDGSL